jgi:calmodulin
LIDIDADGFITIQDLYQLMMGIGEMLTDDELSELLKAADNDGDGMINYKGNIK